MSREIGSEFWDAPTVDTKNQRFPKNTQWYVSGRSALKAIIQDLRDCHSVSMPSWCCDSMVKPFVDSGIKLHFYPVYLQQGLVREIRLDSDVLFLMDYFGYTGPSLHFEGYRGVVIRDVTHSIFSADYTDADYYFGSLRKWCGVRTGGYAWSNHALPMEAGVDKGYAELREKAMGQKGEYIRNGEQGGKGYLKVYDEAEELLENLGIFPAAEGDIAIASSLDIQYIRTRRRANAQILMHAFPDWLVFSELQDSDCPMFVPIFVPNGKRNELRRHLIENAIYCPVHWPVSAYHRLGEKEQRLYDNELSLVCDQRYTEEDMCRIVHTIRSFWKEG